MYTSMVRIIASAYVCFGAPLLNVTDRKDWVYMNVAILGYGTVGRGVDQIISSRLEDMAVTRILELPDRLSDARMTSDFSEIVADSSIDAIVECMGGLEPARSYILQALCAGKSVVTSNKAVVAAYMDEFIDAAREHNAALFIEATCGGGVPWISSIQKARRIDDIHSFHGIMNGTTNYIVDAMERQNKDFAEVLAKAQELGYAERDPSADIDGIDVCNKTLIAARVAFGIQPKKNIPVSGIRNLTKEDLDFLATQGRSIRLLGRGYRDGNRYALAVEPVAVDISSLEAHVPSNFNLLTLEATTVGELRFYGQGAGMLPTGNAMVQDLLDLQAQITPSYEIDTRLSYDASLLTSDYMLRTSLPFEEVKQLVSAEATVSAEQAASAEGLASLEQAAPAEQLAPERCVLKALTSETAHVLLGQILLTDPQAFMAAFPPKN